MPRETVVRRCFVRWSASPSEDMYISTLVVRMMRQIAMALEFNIYVGRAVLELMTGLLTGYSGHEVVRYTHGILKICISHLSLPKGFRGSKNPAIVH
jgi:hypothetical protein